MRPKSHFRLACAFIGLLALIVSACGSGAQPTSTIQISAPTTRPIPPTPVPPCTGNASPADPRYTIAMQGAKAEILWRSEFVPWWVRPSPDGRILAVTDGGDSIYELKPDGTLGIAFRCPGAMIETFAAASDGALWFATRDGGRLYRVAPDETVKIIAQSGNRNLEAGPDGSVYAMENGLSRINQDGTAKQITENVNGRKFAIGPHGEIVALTDGKILRVSESGEITTLASGYGPEEWLTFGTDGLLYVTHWMKVDVIDLNSGSVTTLPWTRNLNIAESGTFAPDGRLLLYHPNTNVYALDLQAQTISLYFQVFSSSWAMSVNPGEGVYIAFGSKLPNGETSIYRVKDRQTLEKVLSVPHGIASSMVFDSGGKGYLAVNDSAIGGAIFRFDPLTGKTEKYYQAQCSPVSLVVHPQTGLAWWIDCSQLRSLDENGNLVSMDNVPGGENTSLAITPSGEYYVIAFFHRENPNAPYDHRLYKWDGTTSKWNEVANLTQTDPGITLSVPVACPDGRIYTVEGLDASTLKRSYSSYNAVRRLEPDGTLSVVGYDFAYDGLAATCDPATNRIIFTSGAGIFAVTPP